LWLNRLADRARSFCFRRYVVLKPKKEACPILGAGFSIKEREVYLKYKPSSSFKVKRFVEIFFKKY